jgi:hypothetical protein
MPEESLETHELREQLEESREHAEHAAHGKGGGGHEEKRAGWILQLSLSTAIIAVLAAIASLQSGGTEGHGLLEKNEAIMTQSEVSDTWAHYQAKSLKQAIYETQLETVENPELKAKFKDKVAAYEKDKEEISDKAKELTETRKKHDEASEKFHERHEHFALAVTIFQVAIALSAIAALTKLKPMWFLSMLVAAGGIYFFLQGFGIAAGEHAKEKSAEHPAATASAQSSMFREVDRDEYGPDSHRALELGLLRYAHQTRDD